MPPTPSGPALALALACLVLVLVWRHLLRARTAVRPPVVERARTTGWQRLQARTRTTTSRAPEPLPPSPPPRLPVPAATRPAAAPDLSRGPYAAPVLTGTRLTLPGTSDDPIPFRATTPTGPVAAPGDSATTLKVTGLDGRIGLSGDSDPS